MTAIVTGKQEPRTPGTRGATCKRSDGNPCNGWPRKGTVPPVCSAHLPGRKARANAAVRAAVFAWKVDTPLIDPPTALLRLTTPVAAASGHARRPHRRRST